MNILVIAHFQGDGTPSATFVHDQVRAYQAQGAGVLVLVPVPWGKSDYDGRRLSPALTRAVVDGVQYCFLRYASLSRYGETDFNAASAIRSIRRRMGVILGVFKPDIIQAHTIGFDSAVGAWMKGRLHCPLVITTHGSDTTIPYERGEKQALRAYCAQADSVVCVSSKLRSQLKDCGVDVPVTVIHNGFHPVELEQTAPEGYDWIQVGNLIPIKHADTTLRAFRLFHEQYPQARCRIIGKGPEKERLEALVYELGLGDSVEFPGHLENRRVLQEMAGACFYVMVSHPEGFGIVYVESMYAGCVTIGTSGEGIADVIENGVNGFLVKPDDPEAVAAVALRCAADPGYRAKIVRRGRETAMGLTWRENAKRNLDLFREVLR